MKKIVKIVLLILLIAAVVGIGFVTCNSLDPDSDLPVIVQEESYDPGDGAGLDDNRGPDDLSSDINNFAFSLNGYIYSLPLLYVELESFGWSGDALENIVNPNRVTPEVRLNNGSQTMTVVFANPTEYRLTFKESYIMRIVFDEIDADNGAQFVLPGNISIGSAIDEVIEVYGEPGEKIETGTITLVRYFLDDGTVVQITVNTETGLTSSLMVENFTKIEFDHMLGYDFQDTTLVYEAPAELGDDWHSFIVKLGGDLYQLPAPLAAFVENGWRFEGDIDEMMEAGTSNVRGSISRGGHFVGVHLHNYDGVARSVADTFVVSIGLVFGAEPTYDFSQPSIELPGGITENSTEEEVFGVLGEPRIIAAGDRFTRYDFGATEREQIIVVFNNETERIRSITVQHRPYLLD